MDVLKFVACTLAMVIALLFLVTEKSRIIELGVRWLASLIVLSALGSLLIYLSFLSRNQAQIKGYFSIGNIRKGLIFVLVLVNALSPYMGLKTRPTFTMYSNLKVEGGSSNHFILPRLFVPSLADDLVTIIDSSDPELKNDSRLGTQWVYLELQRRVQNKPQISIIYRRGDNLYGYNLSSDSALTQEPELTNPSEIQLKLLSFRKVYSTNYCSW